MGASNPGTKRGRCITATIAKVTTAAPVSGLFIAVDHLEREKKGWRGLRQGAPTALLSRLSHSAKWRRPRSLGSTQTGLNLPDLALKQVLLLSPPPVNRLSLSVLTGPGATH
jgi:hypothetical protein